jgi:hypothetical protein
LIAEGGASGLREGGDHRGEFEGDLEAVEAFVPRGEASRWSRSGVAFASFATGVVGSAVASSGVRFNAGLLERGTA